MRKRRPFSIRLLIPILERERPHTRFSRASRLAKRDANQARVEAGLAHQSDPLVPLPAFVEARVFIDQGKYEEALPFFEDAVAAARKVGSPLENLHFYAGDTFQKLDRQSEAEAEWLEELRLFPHNLRAVTALVMMYQTMDRRNEAETIIMKQLGTTPTPESYALAARLLKALGNTRQANAVRAEAARTFASRRPATAPNPTSLTNQHDQALKRQRATRRRVAICVDAGTVLEPEPEGDAERASAGLRARRRRAGYALMRS